MQTSTYRLSEAYIRKKTKLPLLQPTIFGLVLAVFFSQFQVGNWQPAIGIAFGLFAFLILFYSKLKERRLAAKQLPAMSINVSSDVLRFADSGGTYEISTSSLAAVAVDRRSDGPRVIYLQRPGETTILLQGLDHPSQFLSELSSIIGSTKFRDLKWWQGPPR